MMGGMKTLARVVALAMLFAAATLSGSGPFAAAAAPPELLPTDHWAYEELRKLWIQGLVDSFFFSTRPVSRYDIAQLLISLEASPRSLPNSPSLERLLREFSREIRELEGNTSKYRETPFLFQKKEQNFDFRFSLYADAIADNWNQKDVDFRDGSRAGFQAWAILRPNIVLFEDIYVGKLSEGWRYGEELFSLKDVLIFSDRFYISMRAPFLDVTLGRDKLRWGDRKSVV